MTTRQYKNKNISKQVGPRKGKNPKQRQISRPIKQFMNSVPVSKGFYGVIDSPKISSSNGHTVISHREMFSSILTTSTNFTVLSFPIQPGIGTMFPWLCSIANAYDGYRILKMKFEFKSAVPTSSAGSVHMAIDYDARDDAPTNITGMSSMSGAVSSNVWQNPCVMSFDVSKNGFFNKHFTRSGPVSNTDIKVSDSGNFYFGYLTVNALQLGLLYVDYVVELYNPQLNSIVGGIVNLTTGVDGVSVATPTGTAAFITPTTGVLPLAWRTNTSIIFVQPFDGFLILRAIGTVLSVIGITPDTRVTCGLSLSIADAGALRCVNSCHVRAEVGGMITFAVIGTTCTTFSISCYSCSPALTGTTLAF